ncbi:MAG TPA: ATP-binding cassette domain-containing protein [Bacilli bacterium]|nr:ATP-binding cassette domain-containing protein [Bacilli bacterium]
MKKDKIALTVDDLHIYYRDMKRFSLKKTGLKDKGTGRIFKAVQGVSFEVPRGEILGICGKNGSGKSTLLRAISGIFSADKGSIDLHGNTISLLSIGVGFQKKLTGYENILLSGMLLGFSEEDIIKKAPEIIDFSELGDFINKPVNTYSSGMYSKLAFSITAILETDIMLIDEVLSVGDSHFTEKSYNKMKELISDSDRTVIIVSHSTKTLTELCNKVMWLHEGKIRKIGKPKEIMEEYDEFMKETL